MRIALSALLLLSLAPLALADKAYNEGKMKVTHDCAKDGPVAMVNGGEGTFAFTGACTKIVVNGSKGKITIEKATKLTVNGSGNTVTVDVVDTLTVTGNDNQINWKKAAAGDKPTVSSLGTHNTITKTR